MSDNPRDEAYDRLDDAVWRALEAGLSGDEILGRVSDQLEDAGEPA